MNLDVYNQLGEKNGSVRASAEVFGVKPKLELIQRVITAIRANWRKPWAHAKTKGEVRGGGKKPWRQKGTGRARAGSIRSPLWRGGGTIFGPRKDRNYEQKINKKVKKTALLMALSDKAANEKILVIEEINPPAGGQKTKEFKQLLNKLLIKNQNCLFIYQPAESVLARSAKNIANVKVLPSENLNLIDVLKYDYLLMTKATLKKV